jgi:NADH-quinone oxidoreductase subunit M
MLMCAHGLSVSLMFLVANCINKRTNTFEMDEMGGLASQTPIMACFFAAATFATIGLPGFGNFWGEFAIFLSLGEYEENHLVLGLAALGIIISAIFGLRAMARIFYGDKSEELSAHEKEHKIKDLSVDEIIPASLILVPLLFLGLWPKGVSEGIDANISARYQILENGEGGYGLPSCCPVDLVLDKSASFTSESSVKSKEEDSE